MQFVNPKDDLIRFGDLHSWYKHLSYENPTTFYMVPCIGQQPRNDLDSKITDQTGLHWWFIIDSRWSEFNECLKKEAIAICEKHPIKLDPGFPEPDDFSSEEYKQHHSDILAKVVESATNIWNDCIVSGLDPTKLVTE